MSTCTYGGTNSTFTYGADGLRRRMVVGANTTDYLLDGQNVVREILNGNTSAFYLYGPRGPEYKRDQAGNVQWYLYDGLDFACEVSQDGQTWTTVCEERANQDPHRYEKAFTPIEARHFRLTIRRSASLRWPDAAQVSEIELLPG